MNARNGRRAGASLVEIVMGLTIFTTGLLTIMVGLLSAHKTVRATGLEDEVCFAFEDLRERMCDWDFSRVYADFHGRTFGTAHVQDSSGAPALIHVTCYGDGTDLPEEFSLIEAVVSPLEDIVSSLLDLLDDGDSSTTGDTSSYQLLPVEFRLSWDDGSAVRTRKYFFILGPAA